MSQQCEMKCGVCSFGTVGRGMRVSRVAPCPLAQNGQQLKVAPPKVVSRHGGTHGVMTKEVQDGQGK